METAQSLHVDKILSGTIIYTEILTSHLFLGVVVDNGIELLGVLIHVGHKLLEHLHLGVSENTMCVLKKTELTYGHKKEEERNKCVWA